jgi:beta-N-acetylhexosaminidase
MSINISEGMNLIDTPLPPVVDEARFCENPPESRPVGQPDIPWVEETLKNMSREEKIGQMLVTSNHPNGEALIREYHVGGFILTGNNQKASQIVSTVNGLQGLSKHPLWFMIDAEAGLGARVADATIFPMMMAFGAANDPELMKECGRITARESQALGIQVACGPDIDVNTERANPIISTRSMGEDPELVTRLAGPFLKGAREAGVLTTLKHFPGHGASVGDSHVALPQVGIGKEELEEKHLKPYRDLVTTGNVDLVMTAHIWYSKINKDKPWPATLSSYFNRDILRYQMSFDGVLISDAYNMEGLIKAIEDPEERAILGVEAGLDVILDPGNVKDAFQGISKALDSGRLDEEQLNWSVYRILVAKSRIGLPQHRTVDPEAWKSVLNHPKHRAAVRKVCEKAFTEVWKHGRAEEPITPQEKVLVLSLGGSHRIFYRFPGTPFIEKFTEIIPETISIHLSHEVHEEEREAALKAAEKVEKVIVLGFDWYKMNSGSQEALVRTLHRMGKTIIYISFGAPYHKTQICGVDGYYVGYASIPEMQRVAAEVLTGKLEAVGKLPVGI